MLLLLLYVALAGGIGGLFNALLTDNGFSLPRKEDVDTIIIYRPGWIGNVPIGAIAAAVSKDLYGPLATHYILGTSEALAATQMPCAVYAKGWMSRM
jgi:hypothetical protein